jgi:hypothetical protein
MNYATLTFQLSKMQVSKRPSSASADAAPPPQQQQLQRTSSNSSSAVQPTQKSLRSSSSSSALQQQPQQQQQKSKVKSSSSAAALQQEKPQQQQQQQKETLSFMQKESAPFVPTPKQSETMQTLQMLRAMDKLEDEWKNANKISINGKDSDVLHRFHESLFNSIKIPWKVEIKNRGMHPKTDAQSERAINEACDLLANFYFVNFAPRVAEFANALYTRAIDHISAFEMTRTPFVTGGSGVVNLGNSCYINVSVNCVLTSNIPELASLPDFDSDAVNIVNRLESSFRCKSTNHICASPQLYQLFLFALAYHRKLAFHVRTDTRVGDEKIAISRSKNVKITTASSQIANAVASACNLQVAIDLTAKDVSDLLTNETFKKKRDEYEATLYHPEKAMECSSFVTFLLKVLRKLKAPTDNSPDPAFLGPFQWTMIAGARRTLYVEGHECKHRTPFCRFGEEQGRLQHDGAFRINFDFESAEENFNRNYIARDDSEDDDDRDTAVKRITTALANELRPNCKIFNSDIGKTHACSPDCGGEVYGVASIEGVTELPSRMLLEISRKSRNDNGRSYDVVEFDEFLAIEKVSRHEQQRQPVRMYRLNFFICHLILQSVPDVNFSDGFKTFVRTLSPAAHDDELKKFVAQELLALKERLFAELFEPFCEQYKQLVKKHHACVEKKKKGAKNEPCDEALNAIEMILGSIFEKWDCLQQRVIDDLLVCMGTNAGVRNYNKGSKHFVAYSRNEDGTWLEMNDSHHNLKDRQNIVSQEDAFKMARTMATHFRYDCLGAGQNYVLPAGSVAPKYQSLPKVDDGNEWKPSDLLKLKDWQLSRTNNAADLHTEEALEAALAPLTGCSYNFYDPVDVQSFVLNKAGRRTGSKKEVAADDPFSTLTRLVREREAMEEAAEKVKEDAAALSVAQHNRKPGAKSSKEPVAKKAGGKKSSIKK